MKYLSGDFIAEYSRALHEYKKEQDAIDSKWGNIISDLVEEEVERLEDTIPYTFKTGETVKDTNGNLGVVKACPIILNVHEDEDYHGKKFGPNKFFAIKNQSDEEAVTCEGMLRMVDVQLQTSELEKDWGHETKAARYYEDELTVIID
ncbi:MAG: hypothetical protein CMB77_05015 [Euryarchaeota archaeon]|nr:hypothetical protein [Euryarchaeota archaeon]|tara:strand:- start:854 stop:1297 length:444 start_codon:yes stop_codon:yes gene_type:complete